MRTSFVLGCVIGPFVIIAGLCGYSILINISVSARADIVGATWMICFFHAWLLLVLKFNRPHIALGKYIGLWVAFGIGPLACWKATSTADYFAIWFIVVIPIFGGGAWAITALTCWIVRCTKQRKIQSIQNPENKGLLTTAWEELADEERRSTSTWAKAFALANGDEAQAKATYVKLRVKELSRTDDRNER